MLQPEGLNLRTELYNAAQSIAPAGAINGLAQCLLKLTSPGIPDIYQGCEGWDLSLVDPDNRRPVDYARYQQMLDDTLSPQALLADWRSGAIKQALIARTLNVRARHPQLFSRGRYIPLAIRGEQANHLLAFARQWHEQVAIIVVPRLIANHTQKHLQLLEKTPEWGETFIELPFDGIDATFKGFFGSPAVITHRTLRVSDALDTFPVSLMINT